LRLEFGIFSVRLSAFGFRLSAFGFRKNVILCSLRLLWIVAFCGLVVEVFDVRANDAPATAHL
jgi:hypothetical protein